MGTPDSVVKFTLFPLHKLQILTYIYIMASGEIENKSSNEVEKTENDESVNVCFDDAREYPSSNNPTSKFSKSTGPESGLAKEEETGTKHYLRTMKAEQRAKFLGKLAFMGVGTNRVELNQVKARQELKKDTGRRVPEIVAEMERKEVDARREAGGIRRGRNVWRRSLTEREDISTGQVNKMLKRIQKKTEEVRKEVQKKHQKAEQFKIKKWSTNAKPGTLKNSQKLRGFEAVSVLNGAFKDDDEEDVRLNSCRNFNVIGEVELSENEVRILENNPKLAILDEFDEELLENEVEAAGMKVRWDLWNNPEKYGEVEDEVFKDSKDGGDENEESEEVVDVSRQAYNPEKKILNFTGRKDYNKE